jgi:hypothetical protein
MPKRKADFNQENFGQGVRLFVKNKLSYMPGPGKSRAQNNGLFWGICFLSFLALLPCSPSAHSAGKEKMTAAIGWPSETAGWKWDRNERRFKGKSLYEHIDGAAEVYLAYGFKEVKVRRYVQAGHPDILAEVYRLGSSEDAYGVFSLERQDPEAGIGQGSEFGGCLLRFWKGPYFVTVLGNGADPELEAAILSLGRAIARGIRETGPPPRLLGYLPAEGPLPPPDLVCFVRSHVLLNRCFFISHQNLLRLGNDVQAVLARYPQGGNKLRILVIRYPTANKAYSAYSNFLSAYLPEADPPRPVRTEDGLWTRAEHFRNHVIIVFGARESSEAQQWVQIVVKKIKEEPS